MAGRDNPNLPTFGLNPDIVAIRSGEVPAADFTDGMNRGGSCACGIGVNTGDVNPKVSDWTTIDQEDGPRTPQDTEHIGGDGSTAGLPDGGFSILADQDPDFDNEIAFAVADTVAAPGADFNIVFGITNATNFTIQIGDRAWGYIQGA